MNKIKPSLAKGTRDFGPDEMEIREYVMNIFKDVFNLYGFRSIQPPSIENTEVLTGNYGEEGDKLIFRILNSGDFLQNTSEKDLNDQNNLKSKISSISIDLFLSISIPSVTPSNKFLLFIIKEGEVT